jgi:hypothetical protein
VINREISMKERKTVQAMRRSQCRPARMSRWVVLRAQERVSLEAGPVRVAKRSLCLAAARTKALLAERNEMLVVPAA